MNDFKDFIKNAIGFVIMITFVLYFIMNIGIKDWSSYTIGVCVGFGMPMFIMFWVRFTDRW